MNPNRNRNPAPGSCPPKIGMKIGMSRLVVQFQTQTVSTVSLVSTACHVCWLPSMSCLMFIAWHDIPMQLEELCQERSDFQYLVICLSSNKRRERRSYDKKSVGCLHTTKIVSGQLHSQGCSYIGRRPIVSYTSAATSNSPLSPESLTIVCEHVPISTPVHHLSFLFLWLGHADWHWYPLAGWDGIYKGMPTTLVQPSFPTSFHVLYVGFWKDRLFREFQNWIFIFPQKKHT